MKYSTPFCAALTFAAIAAFALFGYLLATTPAAPPKQGEPLPSVLGLGRR